MKRARLPSILSAEMKAHAMVSDTLFHFDAHQEQGIAELQAAFARKRHHQALRDAAVEKVAQRATHDTLGSTP